MLSVPEWFGPSQPGEENAGVVVGLRRSLPEEAAKLLRPASNGWRYVSADQTFLVETVGYHGAANHFDAWIDLTHRAIEPNVFLDPCFALPAVQHFAMSKQPIFLLVWDEAKGERHQLVGLCPIVYKRAPFWGTIASAWVHNLSALGTPLIDRTKSIETLDLMLDWLRREQPHVIGLLLPRLRHQGTLYALLKTRALLTGREMCNFGQHERAALVGGTQGGAGMGRALSVKKLKELRRQRARLNDKGSLAFASANNPTDVRIAAEQFMTLEAAGWKGARGTALLNDPGLMTFTRTMTRLLARGGKCRIDTLSLDGQPVAMGIVLKSGAHAYVWKIAYDEAYASHSPGVQFMLDLTKAQLAEEGIHLTDSCAIADHPMINHVWRDRIGIVDALVATKTYETRVFAAHAFAERVRREVREWAKVLLYKVRGRNRS